MNPTIVTKKGFHKLSAIDMNLPDLSWFATVIIPLDARYAEVRIVWVRIIHWYDIAVRNTGVIGDRYEIERCNLGSSVMTQVPVGWSRGVERESRSQTFSPYVAPILCG